MHKKIVSFIFLAMSMCHCALALSLGITVNDSDGDGVYNSTEIGIGTDPTSFDQFDGYVDPSTFRYAFNLYDDWDRYLLSSRHAEVYGERYAGSAKFWRPLVANEEASIIYKFDFNKKISEAKVRAHLYAWAQGADVNFDSGARAYLDVSTDAVNWHMIAQSTPPNASDVAQTMDLSEFVAGQESIYLRARLLGSRSWYGDGLIFSQFLRTSSADKESFAINVSLVPEPSKYALFLGGLVLSIAFWRRR